MSVPRYRTTAFFNGLGSFKAAFPALYDAGIEWEELTGPDEAPRNKNLRRMAHKRGNFNQGLVSCGNDACREGGYQIDRLIDEMMRAGETQRRGILYCSGREAGEEVRRGPVRCRHRIAYRVTLSYKRAQSPNAA